jgi:hypothetical protein
MSASRSKKFPAASLNMMSNSSTGGGGGVGGEFPILSLNEASQYLILNVLHRTKMPGP